MKIYMVSDLEGVAGVTTFYQETLPDGPYYARARRLLTAEINACVEGLLEAGATEVLVGDWHGPGAVDFEELHPKASLMHGRPFAPWPVLDEAVRDFDACVVVGQHAMAGVTSGNMNHTQSSKTVDYYKLNGRPVGEIAQFALHRGVFDQPVILLTGDEAACREAEELIPGVTTVAVKKGLGRNSAVSCSAVEARRRIREGAAGAVRRHRETPVSPLKWNPPYVMEKRFFHTDTADQVAAAPGAERVDGQTVRVKSDNLLDVLY